MASAAFPWGRGGEGSSFLGPTLPITSQTPQAEHTAFFSPPPNRNARLRRWSVRSGRAAASRGKGAHSGEMDVMRMCVLHGLDPAALQTSAWGGGFAARKTNFRVRGEEDGRVETRYDGWMDVIPTFEAALCSYVCPTYLVRYRPTYVGLGQD